MSECQHLSTSPVGPDTDGGTIYKCDHCPEKWNSQEF